MEVKYMINNEERLSSTFIVYKDWLDSILTLPVEQQDKIIGDFVRYGVGNELEHTDDPITTSFVNLLKGRIDYTINEYEKKLKMSKTAGRKKKVNDLEVYQIAKDNPDYTSQDIANMLGVSKSSIDHSDGWKNRYKESYL